jgi:uncharacterized protein with NRDE domain
VCTLAIYVRAFVEFPLIVAANRDEFLDRPTSGPRLLPGETGIFAGRDEVAGGTWLGINRAGVLAALLNRRSNLLADPTRRSRGQLCVSMLRHSSASSARSAILGEDPHAFNPFNLLVADRTGAWIASNHGTDRTLAVTDLEPGLHLVTNLDLNDPTCPKIAASYQQFAALLEPGSPPPGTQAFCDRLQAILSRHDTQLDPRTPGFGNSLCLHSPAYGTRSSSIIWLDESGTWTYRHTNDAPCRSRYRTEPAGEALAQT